MKRATLPEFDRAVRNTYKVLLTRGMLGYSTDPETQQLLGDLLSNRQPEVRRRKARQAGHG